MTDDPAGRLIRGGGLGTKARKKKREDSHPSRICSDAKAWTGDVYCRNAFLALDKLCSLAIVSASLGDKSGPSHARSKTLSKPQVESMTHCRLGLKLQVQGPGFEGFSHYLSLVCSAMQTRSGSKSGRRPFDEPTTGTNQGVF